MKQIDVVESIAELLYERDSVIIPGFGGFASTYQQAGIDHVQGLLHPPAKQLNFNDNLSLNDGVLVHYLEEKYQVSQEEAQEAIDQFVAKTRKSLENREIVVFPKIGRVYLDFEQQHKFLQDNTNFNADSYGLPTVQFYPVVRYQRTTTREIRTAAVKESWSNPLRGLSQNISRWFQTSIPWIILLSIAIIALSIYFINREPVRTTGEMRGTIPPERVNTPPGGTEPEEERIIIDESAAGRSETEPEATPVPPESEAPVAEAEPERPRRQPRSEPDTEGPTTPPGLEEGIIIIGAFRDIDNAEELIETVYAAGYDAYSDTKGKATRVGVRISYRDASELAEKLARVREEFNSSAWVLR